MAYCCLDHRLTLLFLMKQTTLTHCANINNIVKMEEVNKQGLIIIIIEILHIIIFLLICEYTNSTH